MPIICYFGKTILMTATVDKFGRILIPKKIREATGVDKGTEFELEVDARTNSIIFRPIPKQVPQIVYTDWGWPVITYPDKEILDFDLKGFINEGYEERSNKLS